MWDSKKSVILSLICTRAVILFAIVIAAILPFLVQQGYFSTSVIFHLRDEVVIRLMPIYYAVCAPGLILLFHANALLTRLKGGQVFTGANVRSLRVMSWCGYAAGIVFAAGSRGSIAFIFIALAAGFAGLILRVLKNVLEAGVDLKDENDYTI
jgi:hypothetical protein